MLKKVLVLILTAALLYALFPAATAFAADELKNTDPEKYYIVLDTKNQIVTVYEKDKNGEYTKIVRRFPCTSGRMEINQIEDPYNEGTFIDDPEDKGTPTPTGIYKIGGRERFGKFAAFGGTYARYWTQIVEGNYFHSIMFSKRDIDTMQSSAFRHIGSAGSHGCVRLYVEDAKWLYYYACPGTTIEVTNSLPTDNAAKKKLKSKMSFSDYNAFQKKMYDTEELPNPIAWVVKDKAVMGTGNAGNNPGKVIKRIAEGEQVEVLQTAEPMCKIKYGGKEGYIRTAYLTFEQGKMNSKEDADIIKSTTWMYTETSTKSERITKVPNYTSIKILEPDNDGWTKIQYWYNIGYIQTKYLTKDWGVIRD